MPPVGRFRPRKGLLRPLSALFGRTQPVVVLYQVPARQSGDRAEGVVSAGTVSTHRRDLRTRQTPACRTALRKPPGPITKTTATKSQCATLPKPNTEGAHPWGQPWAGAGRSTHLTPAAAPTAPSATNLRLRVILTSSSKPAARLACFILAPSASRFTNVMVTSQDGVLQRFPKAGCAGQRPGRSICRP